MITYKLTHVNGLHFELLGDEGKNREYDVTFIDKNVTKPIYETKLKPKVGLDQIESSQLIHLYSLNMKDVQSSKSIYQMN